MNRSQEQFKDWKFGLFIHWGLQSLPEAQQDPAHFTAEKFSARVLVDLAKYAGMRYITFTSKHHDGFALFNTALSDFSSPHSPARRDFFKLLVEECRRQGMPLFAYFSLPDLHRPEFPRAKRFFPKTSLGQAFKEAAGPEEWREYTEFMRGQVKELGTRYGRLAGFWFDVGPHNGANYPYDVGELERLVRTVQPSTLIMGRDFYEAEKSLKTFGYLDDSGRPRSLPLPPAAADAWPSEVCDTLGEFWFYRADNKVYRPTSEILRKFVEVIGRGGNYLLNIGPKPSGEVDPEQELRLREIGVWLRKYGEAVYGTRPGPFAPGAWGYSVQKGDRVYLHILNCPGAELVVADAHRKVVAAKFINGARIQFRQNDGRLNIHLGQTPCDPVDTIVALELAR